MSKRSKITSKIPDTTAEEKIIEQLKQPAGKTTGNDNEKKTVRITLDIPKGLHAQIKSHTKSMGMTIKGYLLFLASQDMKK